MRGLAPYPAAWTELVCGQQRHVVKVYAAVREFTTHQLPVGTVLADKEQRLCVALPDGFLCITSLQMAGKKRMATADFLRGFKLTDDAHLE